MKKLFGMFRNSRKPVIDKTLTRKVSLKWADQMGDHDPNTYGVRDKLTSLVGTEQAEVIFNYYRARHKEPGHIDQLFAMVESEPSKLYLPFSSFDVRYRRYENRQEERHFVNIWWYFNQRERVHRFIRWTHMPSISLGRMRKVMAFSVEALVKRQKNQNEIAK